MLAPQVRATWRLRLLPTAATWAFRACRWTAEHHAPEIPRDAAIRIEHSPRLRVIQMAAVLAGKPPEVWPVDREPVPASRDGQRVGVGQPPGTSPYAGCVQLSHAQGPEDPPRLPHALCGQAGLAGYLLVAGVDALTVANGVVPRAAGHELDAGLHDERVDQLVEPGHEQQGDAVGVNLVVG